ncbi:hypothetical protein C8Z91_13685 [Paenibacillus elgii]|uniref:Uncharacterized protein n=1 Tax=Paenibacillus elgii TaxID=189691 RepID=A0A2T6G3B9_9BACL|nr:hypothetical protein [Paenibacillus elgii]PUA38649.1 hypothetical protein C8Z91_13685 [Paenibacillus elgii]
MKHLLTFTAAFMTIVISGCEAAPAKEASTPAKEASALHEKRRRSRSKATITKEEFDKIENGRPTRKSPRLSVDRRLFVQRRGFTRANANFIFQDTNIWKKLVSIIA